MSRQWPNHWLEHANVASLNLAQLFLLMQVKYLPLWMSVWIFCSNPCLIYSLILSWHLATWNTNPGQVVYVRASVYTDQQSNSFHSSQTHQHDRLWDISLLHSIRNHLRKKLWLQLPHLIGIVKCWCNLFSCTDEYAGNWIWNLHFNVNYHEKKLALIHRGPVLKIHSSNFRILLIKETLE